VPATKGAGTALLIVSTSLPLATKGDEESMDESGDELETRSAEDVEAEETALLDLEPEEPEEVLVIPGTVDNASQGSTLSDAWEGGDSEAANISEVEDLVMVAESRFTNSEGS
jgi:hypothetical protein